MTHSERSIDKFRKKIIF